MKILFSYIAQPHQTLHSLPIAAELARSNPDFEVHIACATQEHMNYIHNLMKFYPTVKLHYHLLSLPSIFQTKIEHYGTNAFFKLLILYSNRNLFNQFNAIVVPERTSLFLKKMGVMKPKLIWTRHGAGDRAIGFAKDIRQFDFILMAGQKIEQRLIQECSIKHDQYKTGIYAKFDLIHRMRPRLMTFFKNDKPIILYNPHFKKQLSSWNKFGHSILKQFSQQNRYNLIFAPHYRLFYPSKQDDYHQFQEYNNCPNILIDLGSSKSIDMTYTIAANFYLGDVSSQLSEFLITPRPCLFLNAHNVKWKNNKNYMSWTLGEVTTSSTHIIEAIDKSFLKHDKFIDLQKSYIVNTFGNLEGPTAQIGAKAIVNYLKKN
ncbi:hypothetical protein COMNV_00231 [Commensalibacter sp. Nvir]|uniref:sensor domain-containing protein n=1 Tax=Commensalibacter sp. Nvir TaxID=3069817 RepID=UPI002D28E010|nr:hypothetical protein COMNV_00231 [Commensalibacter sp. Nvir]